MSAVDSKVGTDSKMQIVHFMNSIQCMYGYSIQKKQNVRMHIMCYSKQS